MINLQICFLTIDIRTFAIFSFDAVFKKAGIYSRKPWHAAFYTEKRLFVFCMTYDTHHIMIFENRPGVPRFFWYRKKAEIAFKNK
jgi:hypothetical protein